MNQLHDEDIVSLRYGAASGPQPKGEALPVMLERALDMLDCALAIVDDEGKVEYRNRAAAAMLKGAHGGLVVADGVLTAKGRKAREALAQAVRLACAELQPSGLCLPQAGAAPDRWLRLVVAPVYFGGSASSASRAAVWILNTQSPALPSEELLAALFGLSRAEARLAIGVLMGRSAAEYARLTGVGVATIRTQLHSIFSKTGVRRQAQLVALLSKVPVLQFGGRA